MVLFSHTKDETRSLSYGAQGAATFIPVSAHRQVVINPPKIINIQTIMMSLLLFWEKIRPFTFLALPLSYSVGMTYKATRNPGRFILRLSNKATARAYFTQNFMKVAFKGYGRRG